MFEFMLFVVFVLGLLVVQEMYLWHSRKSYRLTIHREALMAECRAENLRRLEWEEKRLPRLLKYAEMVERNSPAQYLMAKRIATQFVK